MSKITFYLGIALAVILASCKSDDPNKKEIYDSYLVLGDTRYDLNDIEFFYYYGYDAEGNGFSYVELAFADGEHIESLDVNQFQSYTDASVVSWLYFESALNEPMTFPSEFLLRNGRTGYESEQMASMNFRFGASSIPKYENEDALGNYTVTVKGNAAIGETITIEVTGQLGFHGDPNSVMTYEAQDFELHLQANVQDGQF